MRSVLCSYIFASVIMALSCAEASSSSESSNRPERNETNFITDVQNTYVPSANLSFKPTLAIVLGADMNSVSQRNILHENSPSVRTFVDRKDDSLNASSSANFTDSPKDDTTTSETIVSDSIMNSTITIENASATISNSVPINASTVRSTNHNTTVTGTTISNSTVASDNTNNTSYLNKNSQCPEMCHCPDYDAWSEYLVPYLRQQLGAIADNYTDYVLKLFLLQQFAFSAEPLRSILGRLFETVMLEGNGRSTLSFWWARYGITACQLQSNATFYLNADTESKLFPQVEFKETQEQVQLLAKAQGNPTSNSVGQQFAALAKQRLVPSQLYNISFVCKEGAQVVVTEEASLFRYGRWRNTNCQVSTEGLLALDRNWSLIELSVINGNALWFQNITMPDFSSTQGTDNLKNESVSKQQNVAGLKGSLLNPSVKRDTIFPSIHEVSLVNISISLQQLGDVLVWFQKAQKLSLKNNSLADFNCSQLIPSPAVWNSLILSFSGLKSVPACILRPSLVSLDLSWNSISNISVFQYPRYVPSPRLDSLNLNENSIKDVGIFADLNLTFLHLAGNKISFLNKLSFTRLPQLSVLDLSRNHLYKLDTGSFKSLIFLQILDLRHNHLQHFDRAVSPLRLGTLACKIYLNNNHFSHPPFQSENYNPGTSIFVYATDNPFACDCDMISYTKATTNSSLTASYSDRSEMQCMYPPSLEDVHLDDLVFTDTCPVVFDCPAGCTCTLSRNDNTVTVDCSGIEYFQLPKILPRNHQLRLEFQSGNKTQTFTALQDGEYLQRAISINISGRGLMHVPEFLCEVLSRAELLDLSFNKLQRLPACFHSRPRQWPTLEMRLAHNPWSCDCNAVPLTLWLAEMIDGKVKDGVRVSDAGKVWCSADTQSGVLVAQWDTSQCKPVNYLPWALTLGVLLGLAAIMGPLLYIYRLQAMVAIHARFHVRPFTRAQRYNEENYDHEALVVHGASSLGVEWVLNTLLPHTHQTHHRVCVPERDFLLGSSLADVYASTVGRAKAVLCLLTIDAARDEWWLYAFQLARAENARRPHTKLLLLLLEHVDTAMFPDEVIEFLKTNTYLSVQDNWFWKKLFYYLPDPPKEHQLK